MKRGIILFIIPALFVCLGPLWGQGKNEDIKPVDIRLADEPAVIIGGYELKIGDAIRLAIQKNHTIISGAYEVAMADSDYQSFKTKFSPVLIGEAGGKNQKYTQSAQFLYGKESSSFDGSVKLNTKFRSGTGITIGLNHNYTDSDLTMDDLIGAFAMMSPGLDVEVLEKYHMPVLFVNVEQELLKNVIGYSDRRIEKMAKLGSEIKKDYTIYMLSQVVVGVIADYWNVVTRKTRLANADLQVTETTRVRDIIGRNVRLGLVDNFNLNFYNAMVSGAEAMRVETERGYKDALRRFLTTINYDSAGELTGTAILSDRMPEINEEAALKAAYEKRADFIMAKKQLEIAKLNLQVQKNEILPSLTAVFSAATMGQEEDAGKAYESLGKFEYTNIEGKLKVTYLFDNRAQKIALRNACFQVKQAEVNLDRVRREVKDDVIGKIDQIRASYGMYQKMKEARREAEISYRRMMESLRRGRLYASVVKDGLDGLIESRQRELDALVYYNVSLLLFDVSKNELFEKYGIDPDKYIPSMKKKK